MEEALGADFSDVRVHFDGQAEQKGALAFASGNDIHVAQAKYDRDSRDGMALIGHELAHVVQQRQGRVDAPDASGIVEDAALEAEADRAGEMAAAYALGEGPAAPSAAGAGGAMGAGAVQCKKPTQSPKAPATPPAAPPPAASTGTPAVAKSLKDAYTIEGASIVGAVAGDVAAVAGAAVAVIEVVAGAKDLWENVCGKSGGGADLIAYSPDQVSQVTRDGLNAIIRYETFQNILPMLKDLFPPAAAAPPAPATPPTPAPAPAGVATAALAAPAPQGEKAPGPDDIQAAIRAKILEVIPTAVVQDKLDRAEAKVLSNVKYHHPKGYWWWNEDGDWGMTNNSQWNAWGDVNVTINLGVLKTGTAKGGIPKEFDDLFGGKTHFASEEVFAPKWLEGGHFTHAGHSTMMGWDFDSVKTEPGTAGYDGTYNSPIGAYKIPMKFIWDDGDSESAVILIAYPETDKQLVIDATDFSGTPE